MDAVMNEIVKADDCVWIIWQGKVYRGHQIVCDRLVTTVSGILRVLDEMGKSPDDFNKTISSVAIKEYSPVILFVRGHEFFAVRNKLLSSGTAKHITYGDGAWTTRTV